MDIIKLRDQLEDALSAAFEKYDIHKLVRNADCDVLAVTLMSPIWEEFEPKLLDGIVELQKPAPGAGFEEWARAYCRREHGMELNLATAGDTYMFVLARDLYAAWVASADSGTPSDAELDDAQTDIDDARRYRWLRDRYTGFDFDWMADDEGKNGKQVICFSMDDGMRVGKDIDAAIDAALDVGEPDGK